MKKVLFVASLYGFLETFEINNMKILQKEGYEVHCIANNYDKVREIYFQTPNLDSIGVIKHIINFARSPLSKENLPALFELEKFIRYEGFDLIDCHTPIGGVIARLAARKMRNQKKLKVIYTAHGFHFFKGAPLKNWILFYLIEKWLSRYTDILITINKEDYNRAKEKFHMKCLEYVPGIGINIQKFNLNDFDREVYRKTLGLSNEDRMLLSVGELNENKNHQIVIKTLGQSKRNDIHYFIAGEGNQKDILMELAKQNNVEDNVHLLGHRNDISKLLHSADIFIHPSIREGLPVALMEAMACGLPCIVSNIRGNIDLIADRKGGFLFDIANEEKLIESLTVLINDTEMRKSFSIYNKNKIYDFSTARVSSIMKNIYELED